MQNNRFESPDDIKSRTSTETKIDFSPKTYTLRDQIVFGVKLLAVVGIILLMLWLFD